MHILNSQLNKTFNILFILNILSVVISVVSFYFSIRTLYIDYMIFLVGLNNFMYCYFVYKYQDYNILDYCDNNNLIKIKILYSTIYIINIIILLCMIYLNNVTN